MPRCLLIVLITSLSSVGANGLSAQEKAPASRTATYSSRVRSESAPQIPSAKVLIFERARRRAEAREARLDANEAMGHMPTRPVVSYSVFANDLNAASYKPWVSFYRYPQYGW